jgi:hypothetical protein
MKHKRTFEKLTLYFAIAMLLIRCSLLPVDLMTINEIRSMSGSDNATVNWNSKYDSNTGTEKRIEVVLTNPDKIYLEDHEKAKELSEKIVAKFVDAQEDFGDDWRFILVLNRGDNSTNVEMDEKHVREIIGKQTAESEE